MAIFKKPEQAPNGDNGKPQTQDSDWQIVINHLDLSLRHIHEAQNRLSMIGFNLQKPADFIIRYRDSLIKTVEEAGGVVEQGSIEEQIKDYLPKALQREREATDSDGR